MNLRVLLLIDDPALQSGLQQLLESGEVTLSCGSPTENVVAEIEEHAPNLTIISHSLLGKPPHQDVTPMTRTTEHPDVVVVWQGEDPEEHAQLISAGCLAVLNSEVADETMRKALLALIERCHQSAADRVSHRVEAPQVDLDEIGDLPRHLQVKLLRLIQERKAKQLGSKEEIQVDVRVMTATNRDLREEVRKGEFRDDLFYRLRLEIEVSGQWLEKPWKPVPI